MLAADSVAGRAACSVSGCTVAPFYVLEFTMNKFAFALSRRAKLAALASLAAPAAFAQTVPAEVNTAITNAGAMLLATATAVVVAMVAFWGMRKLGAKMGWW